MAFQIRHLSDLVTSLQDLTTDTFPVQSEHQSTRFYDYIRIRILRGHQHSYQRQSLKGLEIQSLRHDISPCDTLIYPRRTPRRLDGRLVRHGSVINLLYSAGTTAATLDG